jgi:hypothetical protein
MKTTRHKNNVLKSQITKSDLISHIWDYIPNVKKHKLIHTGITLQLN